MGEKLSVLPLVDLKVPSLFSMLYIKGPRVTSKKLKVNSRTNEIKGLKNWRKDLKSGPRRESNQRFSGWIVADFAQSVLPFLRHGSTITSCYFSSFDDLEVLLL